MPEIDEEEEADKDNEVIEDHLVHLLTKNFLETFCTYYGNFLVFLRSLNPFGVRCSVIKSRNKHGHVIATKSQNRF